MTDGFTLYAVIACDFRKGWLSEAVPVGLVGVGGPGAPHELRFVRRCDVGRGSVSSDQCALLALKGSLNPFVG